MASGGFTQKPLRTPEEPPKGLVDKRTLMGSFPQVDEVTPNKTQSKNWADLACDEKNPIDLGAANGTPEG